MDARMRAIMGLNSTKDAVAFGKEFLNAAASGMRIPDTVLAVSRDLAAIDCAMPAARESEPESVLSP